MKLKNITLSSKIENSWFYKEERYKAQLEPYKDWMYISYSTAGDLTEYFEDMIKEKIAKVKSYTDNVYTRIGNILGDAQEKGVFDQEKLGDDFRIDPSFDIDKYRPEGAEYEKLVTLVLSEEDKVLFIGFIDVFFEREGKAYLRDSKTGSSSKSKKYEGKEYIQLVLYAYALEKMGFVIGGIGVDFFERIGSHMNKPLILTGKHTDIPLEFNEERKKFALDTLCTNTQYISDLYTTYLKVFGEKTK